MDTNQLIEAVEHRVVGDVARRMDFMPAGFDVEDHSRMDKQRVDSVVQFQIRYSARVPLPKGYSDDQLLAAKKDIVKMYEHQVYKSIRDQVFDPLWEVRQRLLQLNEIELSNKIDEVYKAIF